MSENFSKGIKNILKHARSEAKRLKARLVTPEHLLLGIIKDKDGQANKMLRSLGCDLKEMSAMLIDLSKPNKNSQDVEDLKLTQSSEKIIRNTFIEGIRKKFSTSFIIATHDERLCDIADKILYLDNGKLLERKRVE